MALGLPAFRRLVPPGTLVAGAGLPATILVRGVLTFAFFAGDAYVLLRADHGPGAPAAVAGIALTAATLDLDVCVVAPGPLARPVRRVALRRARASPAWPSGRSPCCSCWCRRCPAAVGISCWSIAGFGIGLAYAPLSVVTLATRPPRARRAGPPSSLQLSDMLGTALGSGVGGVLVALGAAATDSDTPGLVAVYLLGAVVAVVGMVLARRVPGPTPRVGRGPDREWSHPPTGPASRRSAGT